MKNLLIKKFLNSGSKSTLASYNRKITEADQLDNILQIARHSLKGIIYLCVYYNFTISYNWLGELSNNAPFEVAKSLFTNFVLQNRTPTGHKTGILYFFSINIRKIVPTQKVELPGFTDLCTAFQNWLQAEHHIGTHYWY